MKKKPFNLRRVGVISLIVIVALSLGVMRYEQTKDPDASTSSNLGQAIFTVALVLGPSLLLHHFVMRLVPVEELARNRRRLIKNLRKEERRVKRAQCELEQLVLQRDWHRQETTQIRAVYLLAYREAGGNPYQGRPS